VSARLLELLHPDWVIFGTARAAESGPPSRGTPTSTILPGISFDRSQKGDGRRARRELGIGDDAPVVVTVGRLTYLKSQLEFVRVMQRVAESYPDARGIICGGEGDAAYARKVRDLRDGLGLDQTITMTGFVSDQLRDDIMDAADVVLHLAKRESFGLAVVEAGAAGKAVVAADASGPRSLIESGVTGILVPVDDVAATVAAVEGLLADPGRRAALGEAAAKAARRHPVEGMVLDIEQVWKAVLADDVPTRA
jgi:glycosyltransferase involved in cell wall biosynthesis